MKKTKLAVFDIDGTIFRKNLAFELIKELAWRGTFKKEVRNELVRHYNNWLSHQGTYEDYRQALVKLYFENIKGCKKEDIIKASADVIAFHRGRTYVFAEDLIKKLKAENYTIIAISGSPNEIVEEYNKYLRFDAVFGSIYEVDGEGRYTGRSAFEPTKDKSQVVKQYMAENKIGPEGSYAVGDTESDAPMLEIVEHPIAFNPNQNLKAIAEEKDWEIIVEKKDVIYRIKNN